MRVINLGSTKTNSIQYAILNSLDMVVAVCFQDKDSGLVYRVNIIDDSVTVVKDVMEAIKNVEN